MNFNQLVFRNVIRNGRDYLTYFFSSLFSVMVFFVFSLLYFHPDLGDRLSGSSASMSEMANFGIQVSEVVIAIMSFVFLWYAFNTFLKGRKKQLSVYLTIGMSQKKLKKMILYENLLLGFSSILLGTITSLIFSKLILLVSQNILAIDEGLAFYFPIKAIGLTWLVYGVIFILISIFTVFNLRKLNFTEMKFSNDDIVAEPKTSLFLTILGVIFILIGYGLAYLFALSMGGILMMNVGLETLIACVLITILGTFLFFKYASIRIFRSLKKHSIFYRNGNMLTISNLMQRMKSNAMMYFLISIVGAVAFVGIGVSKAVGGYEFGSTQGDSFAVVLGEGHGEKTKKSEALFEERIKTVETQIKDAGYELLSTNVKPVDLWFDVAESEGVPYINVVSQSQINEMLTFMGKEKIQLPNDETILKLVGTNSELNTVKAKGLAGTTITQELQYYDEELDKNVTESSIDIMFSDIQLSLSNYNNLAVASDKQYAELLEKSGYEPIGIQLIHYNEWQENKELSNNLIEYLRSESSKQEDKLQAYFKELKKEPYEDLTDKEVAGMMAIESEGLYYSTMYKTWMDTKQKNGTILLISVLLGSVFFTFSCSIIYFKLFGELEKDGKYHRSLHILGVPEKRRRKMVTTEMLIMFFIPFVISALHFIAAMSALRLMIELPVAVYMFQILSVYIFFQVLFFLICRRQYLRNLNKYAENIKR